MSHRLHGINHRVLATLLVVALPVVGVGAFLILAQGRAHLVDSFGLKLAERAEQSAAAIDAYVYRRILDVSTLARMPEVRAEAERASARPNDARADAAMDRAFAAVDVKRPEIAGILNTPASQYFADITRQDPIYREILLTDRAGRLIAGLQPLERLRPERRGLVEARHGRPDARRSDDQRRALGRQRAHLRDGDRGARARHRRAPDGRPQGRRRHPRDVGQRGGDGPRHRRRRDAVAAQRDDRVQPRRRAAVRAVLRVRPAQGAARRGLDGQRPLAAVLHGRGAACGLADHRRCDVTAGVDVPAPAVGRRGVAVGSRSDGAGRLGISVAAAPVRDRRRRSCSR